MGKSLHVAAVVCATTACICFIVAAASSAWLIGCLSFDDIFEAMEHQPQMLLTRDSNFQEKAKMFSGRKMCVHLGLFRVTMKTSNLFDVSFGVGVTGMPMLVLLGISAGIVSIIMGAIGAIVLLVAANGDMESHEGKGPAANRTRVAMILLVLAGSAGSIGMAAYTRGTIQASKDPLMFLAQVGSSAESTFKNFMPEHSSYARGKRDLPLYGISPDMGKPDLPVSGISPGMKTVITMIEGMEPHYGYAFVLGWVAVVIMICSAVLAAVAKQRLLFQPFNYSAGSKI